MTGTTRNTMHRLEQAQVPAGYTVSVGLTTTPVWFSDMSTYLEITALSIGVLVGLTTLYLNYLNIKKRSNELKEQSRNNS